MKIVEEIKKGFSKFYSLNTDFSITILNLILKLKEVLFNILLREKGVLNFVLCPGYIFLTLNVNNSEGIVFHNFYKT